jgi:WD40 repeat protein
MLLNVGDDVGAMAWAFPSTLIDSSANQTTERVLALTTRHGPLVGYIQLWKIIWSKSGRSIANCHLHSLIRRSVHADDDNASGYIMEMHWVPAKSSSSSSSTGILCTLSSFGAMNLVVVPTLKSGNRQIVSIPNILSLVQLNLAQNRVRCFTFSNVYGNVLLIGNTTGIVELWKLNVSSTNSTNSTFATKLKSFDHMYRCRHRLDEKKHSISAVDWSPHDRNCFVSGKLTMLYVLIVIVL